MSSLQDKTNELKNNSMIGDMIAQEKPQTKKQPQLKPETKQAVGRAFIKVLDEINKEQNKYKCKNGDTHSDNFAITIKIDADIEQFLRNIDVITFIETAKTGEIETITKNEYVNDLIRKDMLRMLNIPNETDPNKWIKAYKDYAKKHGVKDRDD